jgi:3-dehydroquinate synthase
VPIDLRVRYRAPFSASRLLVRRGSLARLGDLVRRATSARRVAVVTDARVALLYGAAALASLRHAGIAADLVRVPRGEIAKRPGEVLGLWDRFARLGLGRRDAVVALGGGSIGDLAGFAAATWLRGVMWVGVPTTLLAQVDSSVGGKTGVDLAAGKNLAGAFHQPALVLVDPELLRSLPRRQLRSGLAEVAKMGMAVDASLFAWTERHAARLLEADARLLGQAVGRAIRVKLAVVGRDEREAEGGRRTALNYGHTLGHAIEAAAGYGRVPHGEAVALGMRAAAWLSVRLAGLSAGAQARQDALLDALGLPRRMPSLGLGRLLGAIAHDKKRGAGSARWVLTTRVGHASVPRAIDSRLVRTVLVQLGARS